MCDELRQQPHKVGRADELVEAVWRLVPGISRGVAAPVVGEREDDVGLRLGHDGATAAEATPPLGCVSLPRLEGDHGKYPPTPR